MGGKLAGFVLMALAALFAWRWLREQGDTGTANRPARRQRRNADGAAPANGREESVITLERDPETGVFRPPATGDDGKG